MAKYTAADVPPPSAAKTKAVGITVTGSILAYSKHW